MEQFTQYRVNPQAMAYVEDHKTLPVLTPIKGHIYRAMQWNNAYNGYKAVSAAMYLGDGEWFDPNNPGALDSTEKMTWADYIEDIS
ncbi:TPA: hypothetical protein IFC62_004990 [Escherichia coli]|uniref:Uncharacterized protein n=1 Tax=Escherichia phage 121Q TaxID=1555202 RepID=A0A097EXR9_9CAUD|nr:hypothetical protein PBI_121Q_313 [Escherichia phage 121Q]AIT14203.1 hypothetical protein PBI_121Q_313 [Escherichia phage 121Q]HAN4490997.1 hypothetical protein [Escherichia coli]